MYFSEKIEPKFVNKMLYIVLYFKAFLDLWLLSYLC